MPPSLREELENLTLSQLEAIWQQEAAYEMFFYNTSAVKELSRATEEVEWNVISDEDIAQCDESKASLHGLQTDVARLLQGLDRKVASISSSQERRWQTLHRLKPQDVMRRMEESTPQKEATR
ncbi:hypothetical protein DIPPA_05290 [Diplonema papillatum]|nr:hypothetical protein DIPPA_05290 [Diplonema papillatum]